MIKEKQEPREVSKNVEGFYENAERLLEKSQEYFPPECREGRRERTARTRETRGVNVTREVFESARARAPRF